MDKTMKREATSSTERGTSRARQVMVWRRLVSTAAWGVILLLVANVMLGERTLAAGADVSFVSYARGRTVASVDLMASPGVGPALARVAADAELSIGGKVRYRSGLLPAEALWVLAPTVEGQSRYGFLPGDAVHLLAGSPRRLELSGVPRSALLEPAAGRAAVGHASQAVATERATSDAGRSGDAKLAQAAPAPAASGTDLGIVWLPESVTRWSALIAEASERHVVDPQLVAIVMLVESGGFPDAESPAGAIGLMQVMPSTGAGIAAARGIEWTSPQALHDPAVGIDFGAWYLSRQLASFGLSDDPDWQRSVELAAAAYNGGPGSVMRFLAGAALPAEAARYRRWVGGMWREREAARSTTFEAWWSAGGRRLVEAAQAAD